MTPPRWRIDSTTSCRRPSARSAAHDGCRPYAEAIAAGAPINQCPPGGAAGIERLASVTGRPVVPLNPDHGIEQPLQVAVVDETRCIGCTLCIQACPVDAIVGAVRLMHTVIPQWCNGCDLCVAPCPMDCIEMVPVQPPRRWTDDDARESRRRHAARRARLVLEAAERAAGADDAGSCQAGCNRRARRSRGRRSRAPAQPRAGSDRTGAGAPARGREAVNPAKRRAIFERLRSLNPQPKSELEFSTPYQLLVAVVLSAQATDRSVNVATRALFKVAPTPRNDGRAR